MFGLSIDYSNIYDNISSTLFNQIIVHNVNKVQMKINNCMYVSVYACTNQHVQIQYNV